MKHLIIIIRNVGCWCKCNFQFEDTSEQCANKSKIHLLSLKIPFDSFRVKITGKKYEESYMRIVTNLICNLP